MRFGRIFRSGVVRCIRFEGSTFDQDLSVTERVGGRFGGGGRVSAEDRSGWREVVKWGRVKRGEGSSGRRVRDEEGFRKSVTSQTEEGPSVKGGFQKEEISPAESGRPRT